MSTSTQPSFNAEFMSRLQARLEQLKRPDPSDARSVTLHQVRTPDALVTALGGDLGVGFAQALDVVRNASNAGYFVISGNTITPGKIPQLPRSGYIQFPREAYPILCQLSFILFALAGITGILALLALVAIAFGALCSAALLPLVEALGPMLLVAGVAALALAFGYRDAMNKFCGDGPEPVQLLWHEGGTPQFIRDSTAGFAE
jgi:hypothetical protein